MYPPIRPFSTEHLPVEGGHSLYVEQSGHRDGIPVVFLHGGPGSGCSPRHRQFFDPNKYRIIMFDQRGAGKSTPHASLETNTTAHLVEDIEQIRKHLKLKKWLVFGGSWGATLALAYAQSNPKRVKGLILRGVFLCRPKDIDWLYQDGASRLFPDYWQDFIAPVPKVERSNMVEAYHRLLTGENELARMRAAEAWSLWEGRASTLKANPQNAASFAEPFAAMAMARIECHFFLNNGFMADNQLIANAKAIEKIPCWIIHGRYDCVCPVEQAWELHQALPSSKLDIVDDSGHSAFEPGIAKALVDATNDFASSCE